MPRRMFGCRLEESWHKRAMAAVQRSGARTVQEWLEAVVQAEIVRVEGAGQGSEDGEVEVVALPSEQLAAARAQIKGMEELIASQRERISDSQAHSVALQAEVDRLNGHLEAANENVRAANANVERMTLMLPAASDTSLQGSSGWRFWERWGR